MMKAAKLVGGVVLLFSLLFSPPPASAQFTTAQMQMLRDYFNGSATIPPSLFANLGTPANGTIKYCVDCDTTDPCAGSGTGAFAHRVAGAWSCAGGGGGGGGGVADPGADGFMARTAVDTSVARTLTSPLGTLAIGNATGVAGNPTLDIDTSIVGLFSTGTATFSGTCTVGDIYYETDTGIATMCPVTNTGRTLANMTTGTADPAATCSTGEFYFETDQSDLYQCIGSNNWALVVTQGTPTEDAVMVGNGTTYQNKVLPNGLVSYDTSTNTFSAGSAGGGIAINTFECYDEFITGLATTGNLGACGLGFAAVGTGTIATQQGLGSHPGLLRLNSHATNDNSGIYVSYTNGNAGTSLSSDFLSDWLFDALLQFGSNSTAITTSALYAGLESAVNNTPDAIAGGIRIRWDSDLSDTTFVFSMCDSATTGCGEVGDATNQKVVASTITPSAGNWYRFRIRRLASGVGGNPTYYFRVNDETEKTFCASGCDDDISQLYTGTAFTPTVSFLTRNTTGVISSDLDYMYLKIPVPGARY